MGLAVVTPRLIEELRDIELYLLNKEANVLEIHQKWADELKVKGGHKEENIQSFFQKEVAKKFERVLL